MQGNGWVNESPNLCAESMVIRHCWEKLSFHLCIEKAKLKFRENGRTPYNKWHCGVQHKSTNSVYNRLLLQNGSI